MYKLPELRRIALLLEDHENGVEVSYYHLRKLVGMGFLIAVDEKIEMGRPRKVYVKSGNYAAKIERLREEIRKLEDGGDEAK